MKKTFLVLFALLSLTRPASAAVSCVPVGSASMNFYVDVDSLCGACQDTNPGTIDRPWCTIDRAFNSTKTPRLQAGQKLHIRSGLYRFSAASFVSGGNELAKNSLSGAPGALTEIGGYPGERPILYLSERIQGWQPYLSRPGVWQFAWIDFIRQNYPWHYQYAGGANYRGLTPQLVAIDGEPPVFFQQVNAGKNDVLIVRPTDIKSVRKDQTDMEPGDFYYENDPNSPNFGMIFLWPKGGLNPNTAKTEVSLDYAMSFGFQRYLKIHDLEIRYSNAYGILLAGSNNVVTHIDASYNAAVGLAGRAEDCTISNSTFNANGQGGAGLQGKGIVYENNVFDSNNWRRYAQGWHCGQKFIPDVTDMTFRENIFRNTIECPDLWLDYMKEGNVIERNLFEGIGLMIEVSNGTAEKPIIVRNNIFKNGGANKEWGGGAYISVSHYVYVLNNLFYNTPSGVTMHGIEPSEAIRMRLTHNRALNNIFYRVSFPIMIAEDTDQTEIFDNLSDHNLFYEAGPSAFWNIIGAPPDSPARKTVYFCLGWVGVSRLNIDQWRALGYDRNSLFMVDPMAKSAPDDFYPLPQSPAINAGQESLQVRDDADGTLRPQNRRTDIGPYEFTVLRTNATNLSLGLGKSALLKPVNNVIGTGKNEIEFGFLPSETGHATVTLYTSRGSRILDLFSQDCETGKVYRFTWDGKLPNGRRAASGIYLVKARMGDNVDVQKVVIVK